MPNLAFTLLLRLPDGARPVGDSWVDWRYSSQIITRPTYGDPHDDAPYKRYPGTREYFAPQVEATLFPNPTGLAGDPSSAEMVDCSRLLMTRYRELEDRGPVFVVSDGSDSQTLTGHVPLAELTRRLFGENDDLAWPHRDGLIWPHFSSVVVGLDVA